ncbi:unnamed protein product [Choristocarpus tenellus]
MSGLDVERLYGLDRRNVMLKIRLPRHKLEEVAEEMRLRMRRRDGTMARFKKDRRGTFTGGVLGGEDIFRSGESQTMLKY